ncbi:MAG: hypothetical protein RMK15_01800 [Chloroflexota bacterium]|nr:hypothetical protein [Dehalococcoidia bacterium]MDW8046000.1 hypothetical protein [Chloroflexota bacterium]
MTAYWELAVVLAAAVNPAAIAAAASELPGPLRTRAWAVAIAWVIGAGLMAAGAYGADRLLAGLELSHETFRIAAGAVLVVTGARETWRGSPVVIAVPQRGWEQGIYPLGVPLFASPSGAMAAVALAGDPAVGPGKALSAAIPVLLAAAAAALFARDCHRGAWRAAGQLVGALSVAVGVAFVVAGVRSV